MDTEKIVITHNIHLFHKPYDNNHYVLLVDSVITEKDNYQSFFIKDDLICAGIYTCIVIIIVLIIARTERVFRKK
jgi:hypothetical protein